MTPGTYLRLRREAAELSITDVARLISPSSRWTQFNIAIIDLLEADLHLPTLGFIERLRGGFAFDRYIYRQLLCKLQPTPEICLACGCSGLDPCDDELHGPCAWATPAHDMCTACATAGRLRA